MTINSLLQQLGHGGELGGGDEGEGDGEGEVRGGGGGGGGGAALLDRLFGGRLGGAGGPIDATDVLNDLLGPAAQDLLGDNPLFSTFERSGGRGHQIGALGGLRPLYRGMLDSGGSGSTPPVPRLPNDLLGPSPVLTQGHNMIVWGGYPFSGGGFSRYAEVNCSELAFGGPRLNLPNPPTRDLSRQRSSQRSSERTHRYGARVCRFPEENGLLRVSGNDNELFTIGVNLDEITGSTVPNIPPPRNGPRPDRDRLLLSNSRVAGGIESLITISYEEDTSLFPGGPVAATHSSPVRVSHPLFQGSQLPSPMR